METKNIELKLVHRAKIDGHEESRDKKHLFHIYAFAKVNLVIILAIISFLLIAGTVSAEIVYTDSYIKITNQNATISDINQSINNTSILEEISPKVWLLKKTIVVEADASLIINDSDCDELRLLSMNNPDVVHLDVYGSLEVDNTTITSWNTETNAPAPSTDSYRAYIQIAGMESAAKFIDANVSYLNLNTVRPGPDEPFIIENSSFIDIHSDFQIITTYGGPEYIYIDNSRIEARSLGVRQNDSIVSNSILDFYGWEDGSGGGLTGRPPATHNITFQNNTILHAGWNGIALSGLENSIAINNIVTGTYHNGMQIGTNTESGKSSYNCTFKNNEVYGVHDNGYYITDSGPSYSLRVYNPIIEDCIAHNTSNRGIVFDGVINGTIRRFKSWNIGYEDIYIIHTYSSKTYIIDSEINETDTNSYSISCISANNTNIINTKYNGKLWYENSDLTFWYYLDVLVQDENGNPISGAKVTVHPFNVTIDYYGNTITVTPINLHVIPREYTDGLLDPQPITETYTGTDGHTPLPSDNDNTLVIADCRKDHHGNPWYEYERVTTEFNNWTITAEKDGVSVTVTGIDPNESWYREDPNTYQNTVTIVLPMSQSVGTISGIVTDKDTGLPIEGATVTADGYSNTTNSTGGYTITLAVGNYTVTASKTDYYPNSTTAQVLENQTTTIDFILTRHKRKLPVAKPVCATGIAILIVIAYWRYRRRRRRMRSGRLIVLVPGITSFLK